MSLPEWYLEGIERVSNIVSFVYPFEGDWKDRYLNWLADKVSQKYKRWFSIPEKDYLEEAQNVWTFVHNQIENFVDSIPLEMDNPLFEKHKNEISYWIKFVLSLEEWTLLTEQVIRDHKNRYQWTIDLVRIDEKNKKVWLYDWKTWWIAKKRWNYWDEDRQKWTVPNKIKKPYDKLIKVRLQLSLYAEYYRNLWYEIWGIYCVWLHEDMAIDYKFKVTSSWDIDELLKDFYSRKKSLPRDMTLDVNIEEMQVRVNTPLAGVAYTNAEIVLGDADLEGKTPEEKIDEAIRLQKLLVSKY